MKYLENFQNYFGDKITIFELPEDLFSDVILESNNELLPCPCDLTKGWTKKISVNKYAPYNIGLLKYKKCCHPADLLHFKNRIDTELLNHNKFYIYQSTQEPDTYRGALKIEIVPTFHWFERLYRKSDPDYKDNPDIFNPDIDEAIDLLINNIDKIAEKIRKFQKNKFYLELTKVESETDEGDLVPYNMIVAVETIDYNFFKLTLITHIKGQKKYSKKYETTKLYVEKLIMDGYSFEEIIEKLYY